MKAILKLQMIIAFFVAIFFSSCEDTGELQNPDVSLQSIEKIIKEMQEIANSENKSVIAKIILDDNNKFVAKKIEILSENERGFIEGFSGKKMDESITVSCSDGTDTHCQGRGFSLYRCVGNAIKECIDSGGCAEVCNADLKVAPEGKSELN